MRPTTLRKQLALADPNGICTAQTRGSAGDFTINGALTSNGVATMDSQRRVSITSVSDEVTVTFTIVGKDGSGNAISEDILGPLAGGEVATELDFFEVSQISCDAALTGDIEIGSHSSGSTPPFRVDQYIDPFQVSMELAIETGDIVNASVQYTFDQGISTGVGPFHWFDHGDIHLRTSDTTGAFISPISALRLLINDGNDQVTLVVIQSGYS